MSRTREVDVSLLFRSWDHLIGKHKSSRPMQYIGEIVDCAIPVVLNQEYDHRLVDPLYRLRDPSGNERYVEVFIEGPKSSVWSQQWRQLRDLEIGGTLLHFNPSVTFTKFKPGTYGLAIGAEDWDPLRVILLPIPMNLTLHVVRRILYFRDEMCWNPVCKNKDLPTKDETHVVRCLRCKISVYCDNDCKRMDWHQSLHSKICINSKIKDLDKALKRNMESYAESLRNTLGSQRLEHIRQLYKYV